MSLVSQNARRCNAEITADYSDGRGEIQATNASGPPTPMLVVDVPQCPQAPINPQCVNTCQAVQDTNDLEVLIDEQSRRLGALRVHDPLEDRSIALVNFMRMKSQKEGSIQQSEMLEFLSEYSDQFPEILRRASAHLDRVFGLNLRVIDPQADTYNLVSKRGSQITDRIVESLDMPKASLLALVLGHILLNGNRAREASIWDLLLKVDMWDKPQRINNLFGNTRNLLTTDFVRMRFLEYWPVYGTNPLEFEFLWGSRAHSEITKMEALKFVSDAHDEEPQSWPEEYNKALEADKTKERSLTAGLEFWSEDTMNDKANDLVQLAISVSEELLPIHQDELLAHIGKEFEDVFPNILNRATLILDMFYGLSLIEVDTSEHIYLLVQQPESEEEQVMLESLGRPTQEYVMPILGLIFLMGNRVKEANVWNLLRRFSVDVGRKHAITCKLMRQRYLECRPLSYSNPVEYELLWGPRAHHETTKMKVLEYMARLYRKRPQDWPEQYREAVEDEEARAKSEATTMFFLGPM
ncbi:PREDICTED: melanoma-associated antigen E2 [Cercocebus atys]|uniref:melanoma-associated antigen E2 n=1 Tax=Cercocebus atys TaxID=9531 RepID=UPI0005F4E63F|nr:PREDICTED: melanoma-associated antigen E2 [Cercocebus atys]